MKGQSNLLNFKTALTGVSLLVVSTFSAYTLSHRIPQARAAAPCIVTIFGVQYDVAPLQNTHTGGNVFICGTDMTGLYQSQHGTDVTRMVPYLVVSSTPSPTPSPVPSPSVSPTPSPSVTPTPTVSPAPEEPGDDQDDLDEDHEDERAEDDDNHQEDRSENDDEEHEKGSHIDIRLEESNETSHNFVSGERD